MEAPQDYAMDEAYGNGEEQEQQFNQTVSEEQQQVEQPSGGERPGDKINASRNEDDDRKIFVGGISWESTLQEVKEYFTKFGEVVDCSLKTDPTTGRSRGFGFILFADVDSVDRVLAEKTHVLKGKTIDPKRAKARGGREPIKKIFVGGMDPNTSEEDLRSHFSKFGTVENVEFAFDRAKNQKRGFCFITFETEAMVDKACVEARQTIGSKEVEIKKAVPKTEDEFGAGRGGRGGFAQSPRGRGRGGRGGGEYGAWGPGYGAGYGGYGGYGGYDGYYGYGYGGYGGYDYGYGSGYPGYDYSGYYGGNGGWGGYGSGYGASSSSGYGTDQSAYGKAKRGGGAAASTAYHPYQR